MYNEFVEFIRESNQEIFIEAEAIQSKMVPFISRYNSEYSPNVNITSEGICLLGDVDKWGVELRIYFNDLDGIPEYWNQKKYGNRIYRNGQFSYRIDDSNLVRHLFEESFRLGYN